MERGREREREGERGRERGREGERWREKRGGSDVSRSGKVSISLRTTLFTFNLLCLAGECSGRSGVL